MNKPDLTEILVDWSNEFLRLVMHEFTHSARASGLSFPQLNVLMHLYYSGPSEVMNFADVMQVSHPGASQMVERMVQQGLVRRMETPEDRRVRLVYLTDEGRHVLETIIASRRTWMEEIVKNLSEDEKNIASGALSILYERFKTIEDERVKKVSENTSVKKAKTN